MLNAYTDREHTHTHTLYYRLLLLLLLEKIEFLQFDSQEKRISLRLVRYVYVLNPRLSNSFTKHEDKMTLLSSRRNEKLFFPE